MSRQLVLVVEDEADIRELVGYNLTKAGYQVTSVVTGEEALTAVEADPPDLVLLDLMLPGMDGLTVCRRLKQDPKTESIPIVMLTAKGEESDVVRGLNLGADDYVTKPFSPRVMIARVQAVLRRASAAVGEEADREPVGRMIAVRNLVIRPRQHQVLVDDTPVELTVTEFRVLSLLADSPGWGFTRKQILDGVHGDNYAITERAVDVQIAVGVPAPACISHDGATACRKASSDEELRCTVACAKQCHALHKRIELARDTSERRHSSIPQTHALTQI